MKKFNWTKFLVLPCIAIGFANSSYGSHIDFLDDAGFFLVANSVTGPSSALQVGAPGNILGSEREVNLSFASGSGFISSGLLAPIGPGPVVGPPSDPAILLLFSNSVNSLGTLELRYDGVGGVGFAPPIDFDTLYNFISVDMFSVQGTGELSVTVTDSGSNTGTLTGTVASAGTYTFPFTHPNYASVDFTTVSRVVVTLETTLAASDFAINEITREAQPGQNNIPEPSAMLLVLTGVVGVIYSRRKWRS